MAKILFQLGKWSYRRKWIVLIVWLVLLAGITASALTLMKPFSSQFTINNSPAIQATKTLQENFPEGGNPVTAAAINMVFAAPEGESLREPRYSDAIDEVIAYLDDNLGDLIISKERYGNPATLSDELTSTLEATYTDAGLPAAAAERDAHNLALLSDDSRIGYTTFNLDVASSMDVTAAQRDVIYQAMDIGRAAGMEVETGGAGFGDPITVTAGSEIVGIIVALLVLLFTFGSLVAAGLPLLTAVVGVGIGMLAIFLTTHFVELNNTTPTLAMMIGLAVGIDYALFILSRYRTERLKYPPEVAIGMAVGTAGSAVVFAAFTVIVALVGLTVAGIGFLSAMGLLAALTVFVALLVALTLLPALVGIFGRFTFGVKIPGFGGNERRKGGLPKRMMHGFTFGARWAKFVHKVPGLVVAVVVLGLGALSLPAMGLQLALPSDATSNVDTTQRKQAELMAEGFGAGVNAPFLYVIDTRAVDPDAPALAAYLAATGEQVEDRAQAASISAVMYTLDRLDNMAGVKNAQIANMTADFGAAQVLITPDSGPADERTVEVSHALRDQGELIGAATGAVIGLTGLTAVQMDITETLEGAMPLYLGIVVGLAIVLLLLVFRSILVPVVAGLGFLLSVGAAFGVTVLFWQEGLWGLVSSPGPLISFMPIFLIGVTFGLAMDYQVFLVSRMREHYTAHGGQARAGSKYNGTEESVIEGFSQGARVVTAAALIMIAVFAAFITQPLPFIQIFGFALGAGVLFDAFFVRMGLMPAMMFILGRGTWWLPKWLDKILPRLDIEGVGLESQMAAGGAPGTRSRHHRKEKTDD